MNSSFRGFLQIVRYITMEIRQNRLSVTLACGSYIALYLVSCVLCMYDSYSSYKSHRKSFVQILHQITYRLTCNERMEEVQFLFDLGKPLFCHSFAIAFLKRNIRKETSLYKREKKIILFLKSKHIWRVKYVTIFNRPIWFRQMWSTWFANMLIMIALTNY